MAQWYVKDLSKLTGVSVQTLHHYDRIELLAPSLRLPNGYRVYSEMDLLRLQQILALKFFGFELEQIKRLLAGKVNVRDHFAVQAQFLNEKAQTLITASETLQNILSDCDPDKSIPWETIIKLIEVFKMTQELEKSWAANVFTPEELKQYARFESELKNRFTHEDKNIFDAQWADIIEEIKLNLDKDPRSPTGIRVAKNVMDLVNQLYGKEHANLKHQIWEKGFKQGKVQEDHLFTPEIIAWLDKANDAYYRGRIYNILDNVGSADNKSTQAQWNALMEEMYGNSQPLKQAIIDAAMTDENVSDIARKWLHQFYQK